jgi:hypothetical protein
VSQADLGGDTMHLIYAPGCGYLVGKGLQSLPIDHQYITGLAGSAGLVEQPPQ